MMERISGDCLYSVKVHMIPVHQGLELDSTPVLLFMNYTQTR